MEQKTAGHPVVTVDPDTTRELRVTIVVDGSAEIARSTPIKFRIVDMASGESAVASDFFKRVDDGTAAT